MTDDNKPFALGPEDLMVDPVSPVDYTHLRKLISRHLNAHLPVLIEEAIESAVEPIAHSLTQNLRETLVARLAAERENLLDDIVQEFRQSRDEKDSR
jgi:hypothetical protein